MITAEQLKRYRSASRRWGGIFDIDTKIIQLEEEELRTQSPDFWNDPKSAEAQMKIVKELKNGSIRIMKWSAVEELQLAYDFVKEGVVTEEEVDEIYNKALKLVEDLELKNMLQNEEDQLGAVLKVNAGAGGTESQDWGIDVVRMYQRWSETKVTKLPLPIGKMEMMPE